MNKIIICFFICFSFFAPMQAQEAPETTLIQTTTPTLQPSNISFLPGISAEGAATILQKAKALIEQEERIGKTDTQILMECASAIVANGNSRTNGWDVLKWTIIMVPVSIISAAIAIVLLHEKLPEAVENFKAAVNGDLPPIKRK